MKRTIEDLIEEEGECTECIDQYIEDKNKIDNYELFKARYELIEEDCDADAIDAYIELGTGDDDLSDFEDAFIGEHKSDIDFAQQIAEDIGTVDFSSQPWPQYCIDWEYAAKELMYDYCEVNGYYFKNI